MIFKVPSRRHKFGFTAVCALVALRMAIGWHFFGDGVKKLDPDFRSTWFLQQAKGPFAQQFLGLIPDRFGMDRLDRKKVGEQWKAYRTTAAKRLNFSDEEAAAANRVLEKYNKQLAKYLTESKDADAIYQHRLEVRRLQAARRAPGRSIAFKADWIADTDLKLQAAARPWIAKVQMLQEAFQDELLGLSEDNKAAQKVGRLADLGAKTWVDHSVTWLTILVGVCLLLGFLVRPAAIVGALFLSSVLLTQPFWAHGANLMVFPYQLVEVCALLFLAAVAAGRYAGLDFFWWAMQHRTYVVD